MMTEFIELPPGVAQVISELRRTLAQHAVAFGALYCVARGKGDLLVLAEEMPTEARIHILNDMITAAQNTLRGLAS